MNGGPIDLEELINHAPAILEVFYPGFYGAS